MASFYGWDAQRIRGEVAPYLDYIRKTIFFATETHD